MGQSNPDVIWLCSPFAQVQQISAERAIAAADGMSLGIRRLGDLYVVGMPLFVENVDFNEVEGAIRTVAGVADEMEAALGLGDVF